MHSVLTPKKYSKLEKNKGWRNVFIVGMTLSYAQSSIISKVEAITSFHIHIYFHYKMFKKRKLLTCFYSCGYLKFLLKKSHQMEVYMSFLSRKWEIKKNACLNCKQITLNNFFLAKFLVFMIYYDFYIEIHHFCNFYLQ